MELDRCDHIRHRVYDCHWSVSLDLFEHHFDEVPYQIIVNEDGVFWDFSFTRSNTDALDISDEIRLHICLVQVEHDRKRLWAVKHTPVIVRQLSILLDYLLSEELRLNIKVQSPGLEVKRLPEWHPIRPAVAMRQERFTDEVDLANLLKRPHFDSLPRFHAAENVLQKQAPESILLLLAYELFVGLVSNATLAVLTAVAALATALTVTVAFLRDQFSRLLLGRLAALGLSVVLIRFFRIHGKICDVITIMFINEGVLRNNNAFIFEEVIEPVRVPDKIKMIGLSKKLIILETDRISHKLIQAGFTLKYLSCGK